MLLLTKDKNTSLLAKISLLLGFTVIFTTEPGSDVPVMTKDDFSGSFVNSKRTTKNVRAYYLNNSIKTYLGEPLGTIDYETGEILLGQKSSLVITGTSEPGSVVKITVKPRSNDIFARREVFLSLVKRSIQVLAES